MAYHKKPQKLLCHICGKTEDVIKKCPDCKSDITFSGVGIEKIEEEVNIKFPNARTAIVSSDTTSKVGAMSELTDKIENGEVDIIIGTQILAKGHHFPNLTLVGVIDADAGLSGTDFRAAEKTYQQLFQVAGRAGRGQTPGRVIIQTLNPTHPAIKALAENKRDDFIKTDMENRRLAKMPPFGQLIALIIEAENEKKLADFTKELSNRMPIVKGGRIFGPMPAELYQVRTWYRNRFLITGPEGAALQPIVKTWLSKVKQPSGIRVKIDVNPMSFL
jgi:primosomal protein N' (replication factor Y)